MYIFLPKATALRLDPTWPHVGYTSRACATLGSLLKEPSPWTQWITQWIIYSIKISTNICHSHQTLCSSPKWPFGGMRVRHTNLLRAKEGRNPRSFSTIRLSVVRAPRFGRRNIATQFSFSSLYSPNDHTSIDVAARFSPHFTGY